MVITAHTFIQSPLQDIHAVKIRSLREKFLFLTSTHLDNHCMKLDVLNRFKKVTKFIGRSDTNCNVSQISIMFDKEGISPYMVAALWGRGPARCVFWLFDLSPSETLKPVTSVNKHFIKTLTNMKLNVEYSCWLKLWKFTGVVSTVSHLCISNTHYCSKQSIFTCLEKIFNLP